MDEQYYSGMDFYERMRWCERVDSATTLDELKNVLKDIISDIYYSTQNKED